MSNIMFTNLYVVLAKLLSYDSAAVEQCDMPPSDAGQVCFPLMPARYATI